MLAEDSWPKGSEVEDGYPEITADLMKQLGWWDELAEAEKKKKTEGKDLRSKYPKGPDPYALGESVNTVTIYGYDPVSQMQDTEVTLCRFAKQELRFYGQNEIHV